MKTKYALKALLYLADQPQNMPVLIADIAKHENIPKKFLDSILLEMRYLGILRSRKGRGGGYYLGIPPDRISMASIVRALDGPVAPVLCVSKTAYQRCADCSSEEDCHIRDLMLEIRDGITNVLENRTLEDVARPGRATPSKIPKSGPRYLA